MQYTLIRATDIGNPYTNKIRQQNGSIDLVYGVNILITSGIVGNTYKGFTNTDNAFLPLDKADSINELEVKLNAFAAQFIADKYPNT